MKHTNHLVLWWFQEPNSHYHLVTKPGTLHPVGFGPTSWVFLTQCFYHWTTDVFGELSCTSSPRSGAWPIGWNAWQKIRTWPNWWLYCGYLLRYLPNERCINSLCQGTCFTHRPGSNTWVSSHLKMYERDGFEPSTPKTNSCALKRSYLSGN